MFHVFDHADDLKSVGAQLSKERRLGKPTVHQHVVGGIADRQGSFDQPDDSIGFPGQSFHSAFVAVAALGQLLLHLAKAVHQLGRRKHDKVDWRKAETVRPAECQHVESLGKAASTVIENTS